MAADGRGHLAAAPLRAGRRGRRCSGRWRVGLWLAGLKLHHAYAAAAACRPALSPACLDLPDTFNGANGLLANGILLQALPALIGAFVGAPVLARELETGTFRYAWTQGFGRLALGAGQAGACSRSR